jgi:hypothetical protein
MRERVGLGVGGGTARVQARGRPPTRTRKSAQPPTRTLTRVCRRLKVAERGGG